MRTRNLILASLTILAAVPVSARADGFGSLGLSRSVTLPGAGVASAGIGLASQRGPGSGSGILHLSDVPAGARIASAYLYWSTYGGPDSQVSLDGSPVQGIEIGRDGDTCWYTNDGTNYAYRADVSNRVSGNGDLSISGVGDGPADAQGASLVVIFWQPESQTSTRVHITDGMLSSNNRVFENLNASIPLSLPDDALSASLNVGFGDGHPFFQDGEDYGGGEGPLKLNGQEILPQNSIEGSDGPFWDDLEVPVPAGLLPASAQSANLSINNGLDCFTWIYAALSIELPDSFGPVVEGVPDRPANEHGWHDGPVTIHWEVFDSNGATQPPDTIADIEGAGIEYQSEPSCDTLGNCTIGTLTLSIDDTDPSLGLRPFEFPIVEELPVDPGVRLFDGWVNGYAGDELSGIDTVLVQIVSPLGEITDLPLDFINCDHERRSCEFGARVESPDGSPIQRVRVTAIDRAGNAGEAIEVVYVQPPVDECPLGPLCDLFPS